MSPNDPIPLAEAVQRCKRALGWASIAVEPFRRSAARDGRISVGGTKVPAWKVGGRWMVDTTDVEQAITACLAEQERVRQATVDYDAHVLHTDGGTVRTTWGGYRVGPAFHFVWNDMAIARRDSDGLWICNSCWTPARAEHEREECHRCRDWSPCGQHCTLSAIVCPTCGTRQSM